MSSLPEWAQRYHGGGELVASPYPPTLNGKPHRESCAVFWDEGDGYWTARGDPARRYRADCSCDLGGGVTVAKPWERSLVE